MKAHISATLRIFELGCDRADTLRAIYEYLSKTGPVALDTTDILRSSVILTVSSFDLFIHEIFRKEVLHRIVSQREISSLKIPFNAVFLKESDQIAIIEEMIRKENAFKSFVSPSKLSECLRPLTEGLWDKIAGNLNEPAEYCKGTLRGFIDLRNRIAHEGDVNPAFGGIELWPIYKEDVETSIAFFRSLARAIATVMDKS